MGKPRLLRGQGGKVAVRYRIYKRDLRKLAAQARFTMPESNYHMIFYIPVSKSWSKKKKLEMIGKPHQYKPDKDNLEKAVLDILCPDDDSHIWDGRVTKYWTEEGRGRIEIIYKA